VAREARLPGLAEWARVRDWRVHQLSKLPEVEVYRSSRMSRDDVVATGARHVAIATGGRWRRDGRGRSSAVAIPSLDDSRLMTPDQIMSGQRPHGPVVVFDDDHYYMASAIAELLAKEGQAVTYVTSAGLAAAWTKHTAEQAGIQAALIRLNIGIVVSHRLSGITPDGAELSCIYSGKKMLVPCGGVVAVTSRDPVDELWHDLQGTELASLVRIGDCKAPGIIAQAVHDGHAFAQEFDRSPDAIIMRRERVVLTS